MIATAPFPDAATAPDDDDPAAHESAACLRPYCCNPFAAFSAFSRVGGWTPPLPDARAMPEGDATA
ncbi:hypothetical protein BLA9940_03213 [Burkholderia aenigmatica]|nr:hypothetical protein CVS37_22680 [Burkholderia lata]VWC61643.1 hypothetical protein BLA9940_03213 [Burkholderia aenigmatica]